jgi:hypothetical protein
MLDSDRPFLLYGNAEWLGLSSQKWGKSSGFRHYI